MSDALVVTFQSQLSIVMETILKSAMIEITRLVEDSFMEEVARGKQEVEQLLRSLQFSESKLKEREKRIRCTDCGRATGSGERTSEKPAEILTGEDALCFRLSLREQSEKRPQFSEVWRSTESLGSYRTTEINSDKEKNINALEKRGKQESNTEVQHPQCTNAPVTRTHEACSNPKSRESHCKTPVSDFTLSKDMAQSRAIQSAPVEDGVGELAPSPTYTAVKSEHLPDPVEIKEEEEMLPVWDCGDDCAPADSDQNLTGSWNRDETQINQMYPENPPTDLAKMCNINRQRTFSVVAREILTQFQVWQRACYSRNIEWGPITAKIISALPYLSGRETEVIVRCTKMLHNRRDYLRRRAKDATLERNSLPMGQRYLLQLHSGNVIQHV
ncbi:uncharacterized protein si:ch73-109d9.1 isoform X3 [Silurus meridionalis]|uniref:Uncharacterized protein n=1 Tax=Silurus meridionalis TaxID=175797 RepID=A0A8T0BUU8_SILME|nr:uncharacterized protein si:ch73-109d9.1 isoform X3 [Silurus meridionalis]KAF7710213.1 hypothetical protein HF521_009085 [Silurus meridionalis]